MDLSDSLAPEATSLVVLDTTTKLSKESTKRLSSYGMIFFNLLEEQIIAKAGKLGAYGGCFIPSQHGKPGVSMHGLRTAENAKKDLKVEVGPDFYPTKVYIAEKGKPNIDIPVENELLTTIGKLVNETPHSHRLVSFGYSLAHSVLSRYKLDQLGLDEFINYANTLDDLYLLGELKGKSKAELIGTATNYKDLCSKIKELYPTFQTNQPTIKS